VSERKSGFFAKVKDGENFYHKNTGVLWGLNFGPDAEIGEKDGFCSGTI